MPWLLMIVTTCREMSMTGKNLPVPNISLLDYEMISVNSLIFTVPDKIHDYICENMYGKQLHSSV